MDRTQVTSENYKQIEYDLAPGVKTTSLEQLEHNLQEYQIDEATESSLIAGTGLQGGGFCGLPAETTEFKDQDFTIYFESENEMLAQITGDHFFILYDGGQDMVTVNLDTGDIKFGDNYTPDKAAQLFWETIGSYKVNEQAQEDYLKTSTPLELVDDMPEPTKRVAYYDLEAFGIDPIDFETFMCTSSNEKGEGSKVEVLPECQPTEEESYVGESAIDMVKKAIVNHKFDDAMKVID